MLNKNKIQPLETNTKRRKNQSSATKLLLRYDLLPTLSVAQIA
jgi:hypothetical protein